MIEKKVVVFMNETFFYCPVCGSTLYSKYPKYSKCMRCKNKITLSESKHGYDYYVDKAIELYNDAIKWKEIFEQEELVLNPIYDATQIETKVSPYTYCSICGMRQSAKNISCVKCGNSSSLRQSEHNAEHYRDLSVAIYRNPDHAVDALMQSEIVINPFYDEELAKMEYKPTPQPTNTPKCPTCGSTNIKKISDLNRVASVALFGLASSKIGKQFECKNCGYKW